MSRSLWGWIRYLIGILDLLLSWNNRRALLMECVWEMISQRRMHTQIQAHGIWCRIVRVSMSRMTICRIGQTRMKLHWHPCPLLLLMNIESTSSHHLDWVPSSHLGPMKCVRCRSNVVVLQRSNALIISDRHSKCASSTVARCSGCIQVSSV